MAADHIRPLQARGADISMLQELNNSLGKIVEDAEYERDGANARLRRMQSGKKQLLLPVSLVQK